MNSLSVNILSNSGKNVKMVNDESKSGWLTIENSFFLKINNDNKTVYIYLPAYPLPNGSYPDIVH